MGAGTGGRGQASLSMCVAQSVTCRGSEQHRPQTHTAAPVPECPSGHSQQRAGHASNTLYLTQLSKPLSFQHVIQMNSSMGGFTCFCLY